MSRLLAQLQLGPLKPPTAAFTPAPGTGAEAGGIPLENFLSNFLGFLTTLAGLMFLIFFIFAALSWITSGGDKGKVESARNQMTQAALGLVVVIAGYGIVGVVGRVLGLDVLNPLKLLQQLAPGGGTP
ncbi:MAG: hypothetical protein ABI758_05100 [Candidatus Woesebacteria bacterium]